MDQLPVHRCRHPVRGRVRHGTRLHPLVLRDRALLAVRPAHRQLYRRSRQLVRQLLGWSGILSYNGKESLKKGPLLVVRLLRGGGVMTTKEKELILKL